MSCRFELVGAWCIRTMETNFFATEMPTDSLCSAVVRLRAITSAEHCDGYSPRCSCTRRTARSRTSGENFVDLFMAPSSGGQFRFVETVWFQSGRHRGGLLRLAPPAQGAVSRQFIDAAKPDAVAGFCFVALGMRPIKGLRVRVHGLRAFVTVPAG
jgi:hypothetical protein